MTTPDVDEVKEPETTHRDVQAILKRPIFVVGAPRSGTTWVQRMLLCHPEIGGGQESHFFGAFGGLLESFRSLDPNGESRRQVGLASYWTRDALKAKVLEIWVETFQSVLERKPTARYLLEKTPDHALNIVQILDLLPQARFIHVIRDSRAVVASLLAASRQEWGGFWAPSNVVSAANRWRRYVRSARDNCLKSNAPYMEIHYEDLRRDGAAGLQRLFEFIGVECPEAQRRQIVEDQDFAKQKQIGGTPIEVSGAFESKALKEPAGFFRRGEVDSWKRELSPLQKLIVWNQTRTLMHHYGYTRKGDIPNY